jgi:hypothetical protein
MRINPLHRSKVPRGLRTECCAVAGTIWSLVGLRPGTFHSGVLAKIQVEAA